MARRRAIAIVIGLALLGVGGCRLDDETSSPEGGSRIDMGGCSRAAVIEDGEDADHQVILHEQRNGYVYTFVDDVGSTVDPAAGKTGATFAYSEGGANGSMYAARFAGKIASGGPVVFAGFGVNLEDPKTPYDASRYAGVSFFARRSASSASEVRLKVPDASTDPDGNVCTECFNDFGTTVELDEHWTQYKVPFSSMAQMPGWGQPRPGSVDSAKLYGLQWQVASPGVEYEVWIDDIVFYGCEGE